MIALVAAALTGVAALAIIPPLIIGPMVNQHVVFGQVWSGEEQGLDPTRLTLITKDGLRVAAYEVWAPDPKAVIIFASGIHNPSVTAFFGHARMLLDEGYASILLEMRAHGESQGDTIALGYHEHLDTRAVVDYIKGDARYDGVSIVVYGLSMGGATAINATGQIPEIAALISLSAFSSWDQLFVDNMGVGGPLASAQRFFVRLYTTHKYGTESQHITPERQIANLGERPALLIHSRQDSQVPHSHLERLAAVAPTHVETWTREGDLHLIVQSGLFLEPAQDIEYAARIIGFLEQHFGR
jgi:hypothetical protein